MSNAPLEGSNEPKVPPQGRARSNDTGSAAAARSIGPAPQIDAPTPETPAPLSERETAADSKRKAKEETSRDIQVVGARRKPVGLTSAEFAALGSAGAPAGAGETNPADRLGPYQLLACVESGKSSQVWEARSKEHERRIAVKLLLPTALKNPEQWRAIRNEFQVGSQFDHPQIIKYHTGHWGSLFRREAYFSMELFLAPNLKTLLYNDLPGVQSRMRRIVEEAAAALAHVHERGYLHRDLKPANLLVNKLGSVRIIGFSLASRPTHPLERILGLRFRSAQGTRSYMAPEMIMKRPLSTQTDVYSFGVMLFEMLTGHLPFTATTPNDLLMKHIQAPPPNPSHLNKSVTSGMDRIVLRMLAKQPDRRYPGFGEFLEDFRRANYFN